MQGRAATRSPTHAPHEHSHTLAAATTPLSRATSRVRSYHARQQEHEQQQPHSGSGSGSGYDNDGDAVAATSPPTVTFTDTVSASTLLSSPPQLLRTTGSARMTDTRTAAARAAVAAAADVDDDDTDTNMTMTMTHATLPARLPVVDNNNNDEHDDGDAVRRRASLSDAHLDYVYGKEQSTCVQLVVLLQRVARQHWRHRVAMLLEVLVPLLFVALVAVLYAAFGRKAIAAEDHVVQWMRSPFVNAAAYQSYLCYDDDAHPIVGLSPCRTRRWNATCSRDDEDGLPVRGLCYHTAFGNAYSVVVNFVSAYLGAMAAVPTLDGLIVHQWMAKKAQLSRASRSATALGALASFGLGVSPTTRYDALASSGYLYFAPADAVPEDLLAYLRTVSPLFAYVYGGTFATVAEATAALARRPPSASPNSTWGLVVVHDLTNAFDVEVLLDDDAMPETAPPYSDVKYPGGYAFDGSDIYLMSGFVTLQKVLYDYYHHAQVARGTLNVNASTSWLLTAAAYPLVAAMPNPASARSELLYLTSLLVAFILTLALLYPFSQMAKRMVLEKELRIREAMLIMGVRKSALWLCFFVTCLIEVVVISVLFTVVLCATVMRRSSPYAVFALVVVYAVVLVPLAGLVSTLFSKARLAALMAPLLYFLFSIPIFMMFRASERVILGLAVLAPTAFACLMNDLANAESGSSFQTGDFHSTLFLPQVYKLMAVLAADFVLYTLLLFYLDAVLPQEWGSHRHPLFFLRPLWRVVRRCCCGCCCCCRRGDGTRRKDVDVDDCTHASTKATSKCVHHGSSSSGGGGSTSTTCSSGGVDTTSMCWLSRRVHGVVAWLDAAMGVAPCTASECSRCGSRADGGGGGGGQSSKRSTVSGVWTSAGASGEASVLASGATTTTTTTMTTTTTTMATPTLVHVVGDVNAETASAARDPARFEATAALDAHTGRRKHTTVRLRHLRKTFARGVRTPRLVAVADLTLDLYDGEVTVLLGPNGAGKSTAINLLTGMTSADAGDCVVHGHSVRDDLSRARHCIGFCPQHNILWPDLTCREHLVFFGKIKGLRGRVLDATVHALLREVDLLDKMHVTPPALSGGQRRKLSVAIAFVGRAPVVVLDEPTAGMDAAARRHTWSLVRAMSPGRTILLSTHFMDEADLLGDQVAIMNDGTLQCCGSSLFLRSSMGVGYTLHFDLLPPPPTSDGAIAGNNNDDDDDDDDDGHYSSALQRVWERLDGVVHRYCPSATVLLRTNCDLDYSITPDDKPRLPALLRALESQRNDTMHIRSYAVTAPSMEDVFLRIIESAHAPTAATAATAATTGAAAASVIAGDDAQQPAQRRWSEAARADDEAGTSTTMTMTGTRGSNAMQPEAQQHNEDETAADDGSGAHAVFVPLTYCGTDLAATAIVSSPSTAAAVAAARPRTSSTPRLSMQSPVSRSVGNMSAHGLFAPRRMSAGSYRFLERERGSVVAATAAAAAASAGAGASYTTNLYVSNARLSLDTAATAMQTPPMPRRQGPCVSFRMDNNNDDDDGVAAAAATAVVEHDEHTAAQPASPLQQQRRRRRRQHNNNSDSRSSCSSSSSGAAKPRVGAGGGGGSNDDDDSGGGGGGVDQLDDHCFLRRVDSSRAHYDATRLASPLRLLSGMRSSTLLRRAHARSDGAVELLRRAHDALSGGATATTTPSALVPPQQQPHDDEPAADAQTQLSRGRRARHVRHPSLDTRQLRARAAWATTTAAAMSASTWTTTTPNSFTCALLPPTTTTAAARAAAAAAAAATTAAATTTTGAVNPLFVFPRWPSIGDAEHGAQLAATTMTTTTMTPPPTRPALRDTVCKDAAPATVTKKTTKTTTRACNNNNGGGGAYDARRRVSGDEQLDCIWQERPRVSRWRLLAMQLGAVLRRRCLYAMRDRRMLLFQIVLPLVTILFALLLQLIGRGPKASITFTPSLYGTPTLLDMAQCSALLGANGSSSSSGDSSTRSGSVLATYGHGLQDMRIVDHDAFATVTQLSSYLNATWYAHALPRYGAVQCADSNLSVMLPRVYGAALRRRRPYVMLHNTSSRHALPYVLHTIHAATYWDMLAHTLSSSNNSNNKSSNNSNRGDEGSSSGSSVADVVSRDVYRITLGPLPLSGSATTRASGGAVSSILTGLVVLIPFTFMPANPVSWIVKEKELRARHLQNMTGLHYIIYWLGSFLFDFTAYLVALGLVFVIFVIFRRWEYVGRDHIGVSTTSFVLYGLCCCCGSYACSFFFREHTTAQMTVLGVCFLSGFLLVVMVFAFSLLKTTQAAAEALRWPFRLVPSYAVGEVIVNLALFSQQQQAQPSMRVWDMATSGWANVYMAAEVPLFVAATLLWDHPARRITLARLRRRGRRVLARCLRLCRHRRRRHHGGGGAGRCVVVCTCCFCLVCGLLCRRRKRQPTVVVSDDDDNDNNGHDNDQHRHCCRRRRSSARPHTRHSGADDSAVAVRVAAAPRGHADGSVSAELRSNEPIDASPQAQQQQQHCSGGGKEGATATAGARTCLYPPPPPLRTLVAAAAAAAPHGRHGAAGNGDEDSDVEQERLAVYHDEVALRRHRCEHDDNDDEDSSSSSDSDSDSDDDDHTTACAHDAATRGDGDSPDVIRVVDLCKVYTRGRKVAVRSLSFAVMRGEVFGFLGTNGAGKSTVISILTQELQPTSGRAYVCGHDVVRESAAAQRCIGYCPQFDACFDLLTVHEHLDFYAAVRGIAAAQRGPLLHSLLTLLGLQPYRHVVARSLSGGNRRKLSVALALLGAPRLVCLDEPSAGMDPVARRLLWRALVRVARCCSILLTTHHLEEVEALADCVAIMTTGTLRCIGDLPHLKHKYARNAYELCVRVRARGEHAAAASAAAATHDADAHTDMDTLVSPTTTATRSAPRVFVDDANSAHTEVQTQTQLQQQQQRVGEAAHGGESERARGARAAQVRRERLQRFMHEHFPSSLLIEEFNQERFVYSVPATRDVALAMARLQELRMQRRRRRRQRRSTAASTLLQQQQQQRSSVVSSSSAAAAAASAALADDDDAAAAAADDDAIMMAELAAVLRGANNNNNATATATAAALGGSVDVSSMTLTAASAVLGTTATSPSYLAAVARIVRLSDLFEVLQQHQDELEITEYSISHMSLEQVFLRVCSNDDDDDNDDDDNDGSHNDARTATTTTAAAATGAAATSTAAVASSTSNGRTATTPMTSYYASVRDSVGHGSLLAQQRRVRARQRLQQYQ